MTITSLVDDYCPKRGLRGEHGLSLLVQAAAFRILFDTGQDDAFLANAEFLGIDLSTIDAIVLSHGHYDHGGGLTALIKKGYASIPLHAGAGFTDARYSRVGEKLNSIGLDAAVGSISSTDVRIVESPLELAPGCFIMPKAERSDGSVASARFKRLCEGEEVVDGFDDELSLVVKTAEGLVVITGCAHRGAVNIARATMKAFPGAPLKALIGGMHLVDAPSSAIMSTALAVAALEPKAVYCSHCTGLNGFAALLGTMPGKVSWLSCGTQVDL